MATVLTMGTFDLLHPGHITLLRVCKEIAGPTGKLVVTVNSSEFVAQFKSKPPVQSTEERYSMVSAVRYVDEVFVNSSQDAKPLITSVNPNFLVIGSDWATKDYYAQLEITAEFLHSHEVALLYLDRNSAFSSTELKERTRNA